MTSACGPYNLGGSATPTAVADAEQIMRTCEGCQYYARQTQLLAQALQMIPITWPFVVWGLDLVGPFKKVPGGFIHLLVTIDKFTKWIEARPMWQNLLTYRAHMHLSLSNDF